MLVDFEFLRSQLVAFEHKIITGTQQLRGAYDNVCNGQDANRD
jgi:hypothetical protein